MTAITTKGATVVNLDHVFKCHATWEFAQWMSSRPYLESICYSCACLPCTNLQKQLQPALVDPARRPHHLDFIRLIHLLASHRLNMSNCYICLAHMNLPIPSPASIDTNMTSYHKNLSIWISGFPPWLNLLKWLSWLVSAFLILWPMKGTTTLVCCNISITAVKPKISICPTAWVEHIGK